ncbi:hypothetical protein CFC21_038279 [Triticum aestivum]|uniref:PLATZ transcription factor family protein n=2 Tax=Triticum aestivum TaxID=4565 RepID=A0A3B6ES41_WHEAT|nr:protein RGF1 INDUCIBLE TRANSCRIPTION FACTOR 1-like [Triticum aestivum]KAF7026152.1 hypothetical protein CFC21_038279 [Triticum aestivum]
MKGGMVPTWLELLLATQFFTICTNHLSSTRNECNLFCIDCEESKGGFCYYCRSRHHSTHRVIQIRRSSYHDVVRVAELKDILDISDVQTYVINSATVVFLNERPQHRGCGVSAIKASSSSYNCEICNRALLDPFRFCSLGCNLKGIKEDMRTSVPIGDIIDYTRKDDDTDSSNTSGNSGNNEGSCSDADYCKDNPSPPRVIRHRRKGIPQRAPFF